MWSPSSAALLKSYGISKVTGDRYAGEWPRERFQVHGIIYEPAAKPKSDLYRDLLPALNSRKVELLDDARLIAQLCSLERRTARGGRDSIDHAPGAHDDLANACCRSRRDAGDPWLRQQLRRLGFGEPGAKTNDGQPAFCAPKRSVWEHPI